MEGDTLDFQTDFSQLPGVEGQLCVCSLCSVLLGLSFELLAAVIRAKLGSGQHFACCFGAYILTPNGTQLRHKWQIYEHAGIQGQSCACASCRAWFGASFAPIWACLIFLVGPELGIKQPTKMWLRR